MTRRRDESALALAVLLVASVACRRSPVPLADGGAPSPGTTLDGSSAADAGPGDGTADHGDALDGAPDTGDARDGAPTGDARDGAPDTGDARDGAPDIGDALDGAPDTGDALDGAPDTGDARDGAPDTGDARDGAPDSADARDGGPDRGGSKPRVLVQVLSGAPWYASQATQGIAVDAAKRVYVGDNANIFVVVGSTVSTYLTATEIAGPDGSSASLGDMDIGPDGRIYFVMSEFVTGKGQVIGIMRSSTAHQAEPWVDLSQLNQPKKMSVITDGYAAVVSNDGFWTFTDAGGQLVYDMTKLVSTQTCATQDLAAAPSGVFLYQPGCNGSPLLRGHADGSGVGVLYDSALLQTSVVNVDNFTCSGRDPAGGFYFAGRDINDSPLLFHVTEDASGTSGLEAIPTVPTFAQAQATNGETFGFWFCSLAVAGDGTVFFQTYHQLWAVLPP